MTTDLMNNPVSGKRERQVWMKTGFQDTPSLFDQVKTGRQVYCETKMGKP